MPPFVLIGPAPMRALSPVWGPPLLAAGLTPKLPPMARQMTEEELREQLQGCVASLAGSEPYTREVLKEAAANGLKIIARAGVGYDAVDIVAATEFGIVVGYAPGSNHEAVAEHTLLLMLAQAKNLLLQHAATAAGKWPRKATLPVRGRTLGIIGLGRVGKAVASRAKSFGIRLVATEPVPDHAFIAANGITLMPFEELLRTSDWVSLHCPLTDETRNMINGTTLSLMKPTAYLINTARGEVVDEHAVAAALVAKTLAGAAIDVFAEEPFKATHPLAACENAILTAHTAGVDKSSQENMVLFAAECIADFMSGKWPGVRIVNPDVRTAMLREG